MQAHPTHRRVICGRCGAPQGGAPLRPQDVRGSEIINTQSKQLDWDVPFRILSAATLRPGITRTNATPRGNQYIRILFSQVLYALVS